jgi:hypothetical protein
MMEVGMDRTAEARVVAQGYIERYGEAAVEVIRRYSVEAHRNGDHRLYWAWRDIGVAADGLLAERAEQRRARWL